MCAATARDVQVSRDELMEFVRPRHHGILATERADGSPQLSPVTMGTDAEGRIVVSSYPERAKSRNARRRPRASMCVLSDDFGGEWVQVSGRMEVLDLPEGLDALVEYYRGISGEHPDWDEYRSAMQRQGKVLLRLTIDRWGPLSRGGFPPGRG
jgi:PPOX class probable F420-dependent enzyme